MNKIDKDWPATLLQQSPPPAVQPGSCLRISVSADELRQRVQAISRRKDWAFAGIVPVRNDDETPLRLLYMFYSNMGPWIAIEVHNDHSLTTVSDILFAADWQEREMEDLFNVVFTGHPQLGNFVLHDEQWPEKFAPMVRNMAEWEAREDLAIEANPQVATPQIVTAPGSFVMTVGPVFSGVTESIQFFLETVGEEIIFAHIRPFYKYRAVEKLFEGMTGTKSLLLAERIDGLSAFAHTLAVAQALEKLAESPVSPRARLLRTFWAEFERIRSHVQGLAGILESTGLSVPANLMHALEERLLQLSGVYAGHRYLFGLMRLGGLARDWSEVELEQLLEQLDTIVSECSKLVKSLAFDNSFLDRLEEVGTLTLDLTRAYGLVGPIARASGLSRDLRKWQPYAAYEQLEFTVPVQGEGDGYARFRQLFSEIEQSLRILKQIPGRLKPGDVIPPPFAVPAGAAISYTEGPGGAIFVHVSTAEDGTVRACRIITPGLVNWHAFPSAIRHFTFQDFPIILATFGLSVADLDR